MQLEQLDHGSVRGTQSCWKVGEQCNIAPRSPPSSGHSISPLLCGLGVEVLPLSRTEVIFPSVEFVLFVEVVREKNQNRGC